MFVLTQNSAIKLNGMSTVINILNKYSTDITPTDATATWSTYSDRSARGASIH